MAATLQDALEFIRNNPNMGGAARQQLVEALNAQTRAVRRQAKVGLYPGLRVTFFSNRVYKTVVGVITKVNRVNVDLREEGTGMKWRVSPQLLKPVEKDDGSSATGDEF